jgi:hypothetical protein
MENQPIVSTCLNALNYVTYSQTFVLNGCIWTPPRLQVFRLLPVGPTAQVYPVSNRSNLLRCRNLTDYSLADSQWEVLIE